jgi:urea transporter
MTLAIILEPGFTSLALPGLTAPFVLACWLVKAGTRLTHQAARDCAPLHNAGQSS